MCQTSKRTPASAQQAPVQQDTAAWGQWSPKSQQKEGNLQSHCVYLFMAKLQFLIIYWYSHESCIMEDESEFEGTKGKKNNGQALRSSYFDHFSRPFQTSTFTIVYLQVAISIGFRLTFATF